MRAAFYDRQGPARDVLQVADLPTPEPGPGDVRVRVHVSAVNPSDTKTRSGYGGAPMSCLAPNGVVSAYAGATVGKVLLDVAG